MILTASVAIPARAAFEVKDTSWEGTSSFLKLVRDRVGTDRVKILSEIRWSDLTPGDALVVIHPEVDLDPGALSSFLSGGGRVALLDDFGAGDRLLERFHLRRVPAPARPLRVLRDNPLLAIAVPYVKQIAGHEQGRHPIVDDVELVVTNHATAIRPSPDVELTPILTIPASSEADGLLAAVGVIGDAEACGVTSDQPTPGARCGRLLVAGDASVLINLMLRYPGNRAFASGLVDYLLEDDAWGERGGNLYLVSNEFDQSGQFGGGSSLGDRVQRKLDELDRWLSALHDDGLSPSLAMLLAGLGIVAMAVWGFRHAARRYSRPLPRFARPIPLVAQGGMAGRAAVLAAPTTHKALAALEVKAALEELLRQRLKLDQNTSKDTIMEALRGSRALGSERLEQLGRLLTRLSRIEQAVAGSQGIRVTDREVQAMHRQMLAMVDELERGSGS